MDISIHEASAEEATVVANLVRFYVYDMSRWTGWACPEDGLFAGCDDLPRYWSDPRNRPFLLRSGTEIAGFALVDGAQPEAEVDHAVGEFFILGKFQRRGAGTMVAMDLFDRLPGRWKVEQLVANGPAVAFWRRVVENYTAGRFQESDRDSPWGLMKVLTFTGGPTPDS